MFNVGDIIVGTSQASHHYTVTTSWATLEVVSYEPNHPVKGKYAMRARLVDHQDNKIKGFIGQTYVVDSRYFVLKNLDNRRLRND